MSDRYARQRLLAAVGDLGQARIAAATYVVGSEGGASTHVEREYLSRAGARQFAVSGAPEPAFSHAAQFRNPEARAFAAGAWRALNQLQRALERG